MMVQRAKRKNALPLEQWMASAIYISDIRSSITRMGVKRKNALTVPNLKVLAVQSKDVHLVPYSELKYRVYSRGIGEVFPCS